MSAFSLLTFAAWALVVANARLVRGKLFAIFAGVLTAIYSLSAIGFMPLAKTLPIWPLYCVLHGIVFLHLFLLARPRMRSLLYRVLISIPASYFLAGTVLSWPWGVLIRLGFHPYLPWLPYALGVVGLWQSLFSPRRDVDIVIDDVDVPALARHRTPGDRTERPLRIAQISDPHLGPFMSVERLRDICERAVQADPDLVLLTGDFLTMESQQDVSHLLRALEPLKVLSGRTFACHGNHDHEAPQIVAQALRMNGIRLLVDEACTADTPWGPVDLIGFDFVSRDRAAHLSRIAAEYPRTQRLRIALLHDPGAFRHVPLGTADLVLAGHTHGGQLGFLSLGGSWTVPRIIDMPDHGVWARGRDRLYVHRGTGHYGFPLRIGVPAEEGLLLVHDRRAGAHQEPPPGAS